MTENHIKTLVFTTLDILQLKQFMILRIFTAWIFCIFLLIMRADISKKYIEGVNKYLIFTESTDENRELLKKWNDVWNGMKNQIEEVSSGECDYEKDYIKIKFNSDDNLPLNKPLTFHSMTIAIRSVFEEDSKLYRQVFLDDTLYELHV